MATWRGWHGQEVRQTHRNWCVKYVAGTRSYLRDGSHANRHSVSVTAFQFKLKFNISITKKTIRTFLESRGYHYRHRPRKSRLTEDHRINRKKFIDFLLEKGLDQDCISDQLIVFSDSTHVDYESALNRQNDGLLLLDGDEVPPTTRNKHVNHEHIYSAVTKYGMLNAVFVEDPTKTRVKGRMYAEDILP